MNARVTGWLVVGLLVGTTLYALAEELTLTTYYPSPRGVYNELRTRGDVAIGKLDTPSARLEIVGSGATSATSALRIRNVDGTALLEVQNGGNVGIGTTSPGSKLTVTGYIESTAAGFKFPDSTVQITASPWAASGSNISNTNSGNVGIGTMSPGYKLEVLGGAINAGGGLIIEKRTSDPPSPVTGQMWLRTDF